MSYYGLDIIRSLGTAKTCAQVILVTTTSRTEVWVQEGHVVEVGGCNLDELLARLMEENPVAMVNPMESFPSAVAESKITVHALEIARQHDMQSKPSAPNAVPTKSPGATISHKIKPPVMAQEMKKARPILFKPGEPPSITIGRDEDCNLITHDHKASRRHCRITMQQDNFFVQDLSSTNGTFLNGERIQAVKARAGDVLMIGEDRFILMSENGF